MPSENSQARWILTMNAKRLIYLSLLLGLTSFNSSQADPYDDCIRDHPLSGRLCGDRPTPKPRDDPPKPRDKDVLSYDACIRDHPLSGRLCGDRPTPESRVDPPKPPGDYPQDDELWYESCVKNHSQELCRTKQEEYKSCLKRGRSADECKSFKELPDQGISKEEAAKTSRILQQYNSCLEYHRAVDCGDILKQ